MFSWIRNVIRFIICFWNLLLDFLWNKFFIFLDWAVLYFTERFRLILIPFLQLFLLFLESSVVLLVKFFLFLHYFHILFFIILLLFQFFFLFSSFVFLHLLSELLLKKFFLLLFSDFSVNIVRLDIWSESSEVLLIGLSSCADWSFRGEILDILISRNFILNWEWLSSWVLLGFM